MIQLSRYNLANIFSIVNLNQNSYFNLSKTLTIKNTQDTNSIYYTIYQVSDADTWTGISYKFYNTIQLWWVICKFNNIKQPFQQLVPGLILKIPTEFIVNQILATIIK